MGDANVARESDCQYVLGCGEVGEIQDIVKMCYRLRALECGRYIIEVKVASR